MKQLYGAWPSALSAEMAALGGVRFGDLCVSESRDGTPLVWWSVAEDGFNRVKVARVGQAGSDAGRGVGIEAVGSARSRVNEYGGGALWTHGESLFWVDDADQRIRRVDLFDGGLCLVDGARERIAVDLTGPGRVLVPEPPAARSVRYAAGVVEPGGAWMVVEREVHTDAEGAPLDEVVNDLAWLPTGLAESHPTSSLPDGVRTLVSDADFCAAPTLSPDGRYLAWLRWNHPDMPWDSSELMVGELIVRAEGPAVESVRRVAGPAPGGGAVSVCLPAWDCTGRLWWCDDREDRWYLCAADGTGLPEPDSGRVVFRTDGEVGYPRWVSGGSRYGFAGGKALAGVTVGGLDRLDELDVSADVGAHEPGDSFDDSTRWPLEPGWIDCVRVLDGPSPLLAAIAGSPESPSGVVVVGRELAETYGTTPWPLPAESVSVPESITFPTGADPARGEATAHGLFYPPRLDGFEGLDGELPPLVVRIHGGPTAAARAELSGSIQFWTTRGFAVVDVNYRGSTGYGRAYRELLRGGWGEVEVQDCIAAAEFLAATGRVDAQRCVIRGGSAGGFTALEAVAAPPTQSGFAFAAATTLYGVTDLAALASDTHKFESRYLDGLVGELPAAAEVYRARSPQFHADRIAAPVLVLQGLEDPVVPPSQAEVLVEAMKRSGLDYEYRTYEGEGHGFRRTETIIDALEAELAFYLRVLGIA